jgi:MFS family permease
MPPASRAAIESPYAWLRLVMSLLLMTIGGSGMYSITVVLPRMQQDFAVSRGDASLAYTLTMIGFGVGGVLMGRLADRFGVMVVVMTGALGLGLGYIAASFAPGLLWFCLAQGVFIGLLGTSATFAPLVADTSRWFDRRRGIALAICMSGNYTAGAVWPPVMQYFIDLGGWRQAYLGMGVFCIASMVPMALLLRPKPPAQELVATTAPGSVPHFSRRPLGLPPNVLLALLSLAGVSCCVAMSMPQVHIVAYCGDLGYGVARGAQMLSLMLGFGIISRLASGVIADRIGGLPTLLLGSGLQGFALLLYLGFDGMTSLYVISALFGLFQGGIVPSYAIIVREYFPANEAATRLGVVLMATLFGMAFGGWLSGAIFDLTGSYKAAFLNGVLWNVLNFGIVAWLITRSTWRMRLQGSAA